MIKSSFERMGISKGLVAVLAMVAVFCTCAHAKKVIALLPSRYGAEEFVEPEWRIWAAQLDLTELGVLRLSGGKLVVGSLQSLSAISRPRKLPENWV